MYLSRYHYTNGQISVAIDSLTGELLELVNEKTGENLIKNSSYLLHQPFQICIKTNSEKIRLFGGNAYQIADDPLLRPSLSEMKTDDGGISVAVRYDRLTDGKKSYLIHVEYTLDLPGGKAEAVWSMKLHNDEPDLLVQDVRFPCINGVYLGDSWKDDTLVYPYHVGIKIQNPVEVFAGPHRQIYWKWQEYRYVYEMLNPAAGPDADGLYSVECAYSGNLSMTWLDYYGGNTGLYFANHDPEPHICSLRAETYGPNSPGMNFSFLHRPYTEYGASWESPRLVAALHEGDWHQGAKIYRAFRKQYEKTEPVRPEWFDKSAGLIAHYDFMYQNGGIVHRYSDIPRLLDEARELGINHLLLSGWNHDGFDHGFPEYYPDEKLGTPEELKAGISEIVGKGGHVCFYINSRLANVKYDYLKDFIRDNVVVKEDGSPYIENYGNQKLNFGVMCVNSPGWPERLRETLRFLTEEIGVDGVYLDQLAMAPPCVCHNKNHHHEYDCWNTGYQELLSSIIKRREEVKPGAPISIIHEGVSDSYGGLSSGHLISTFSYYHLGAFPELYKYTFPEHILVEMLYPERNMAMRPVHVGQVSTAIINKAFVTGSYYWIYDLVDDNTFTRDPEQYAYLKDTITLRNFWLETFGQGTFRDTDGVLTDGPVMAKCFDLSKGRLYACAREKGRKEPVSITIDCPACNEVNLYFSENGSVCKIAAEAQTVNGKLHIAPPNTPLVLISVCTG